jgi:hypothetical protein
MQMRFMPAVTTLGITNMKYTVGVDSSTPFTSDYGEIVRKWSGSTETEYCMWTAIIPTTTGATTLTITPKFTTDKATTKIKIMVLTSMIEMLN